MFRFVACIFVSGCGQQNKHIVRKERKTFPARSLSVSCLSFRAVRCKFLTAKEFVVVSGLVRSDQKKGGEDQSLAGKKQKGSHTQVKA